VCFGSAQDGDPNKPADAKMGAAPPDRVVSRVGSGEGARQLDLGIASRFACVLLFLLLLFLFCCKLRSIHGFSKLPRGVRLCEAEVALVN
jgi:hypothetical protein